MSRDDFSQRPFVAGSLIGIRSFRLTSHGNLTGCIHQTRWTAGENNAKCFGNGVRAFHTSMQQLAVTSWDLAESWRRLAAAIGSGPGPVNLIKRPTPPSVKADPPHRVAALDCTCGFYAYLDLDHNPYHKQPPFNLLGIVESYGLTTVGSRGFRCETARIAALIVHPEHEQIQRVAKMQQRYDPTPTFATVELALAEYPLTKLDDIPQAVAS